jgi:hypothetical protein
MSPSDLLDKYLLKQYVPYERNTIIHIIQENAVKYASNDYGSKPSSLHREFVNLFLLVKENEKEDASA